MLVTAAAGVELWQWRGLIVPVCAVRRRAGGAGDVVAAARPRWQFSNAAVQVIATYLRTFPLVFAALESMGDGEMHLTPDDVGGVPAVDKVSKWIAQVRTTPLLVDALCARGCQGAMGAPTA